MLHLDMLKIGNLVKAVWMYRDLIIEACTMVLFFVGGIAIGMFFAVLYYVGG